MLPLATPPDDSVPALLAAAESARRQGAHRAGARIAEQLIARELATPPIELAQALRLAALHRWRLGDVHLAIDHARAAEQLCTTLADEAGQVDALLTLSMALVDSGAQREALDTALRGLELARSIGDARLECWALNRLAIAFKRLDDLPMAIRHGRQALVLAQRFGGDEETFASLNNLASQLLAQAEWHERDGQDDPAHAARIEARSLSEQALASARRSGNVHREAVAMGNLAEALIHDAEFDAAESMIEAYRALALRHGFEGLACSAHHDLTRLLQKSDRHAEALVQLGEWRLRELARGTAPAAMREIEYALYVSHKALGQTTAALLHLEAHARMERQALLDDNLAKAQVQLGRLDIERSRETLAQVRSDLQNHRDRAEALEADRERLSAQAEAADRAAREDVLTGLPNRRAVDETLPGLLAHAEAGHAPLALAMLDVDRFKGINDAFGHATGDAVLAELGQVLRARLRGGDLLARIGGEEFMLALPGATVGRAAETCERLRAAVAAHDWNTLTPGLAVTISLGLVEREPGEARLALVARADAALYRAKREGRDRLVRA